MNDMVVIPKNNVKIRGDAAVGRYIHKRRGRDHICERGRNLAQQRRSIKATRGQKVRRLATGFQCERSKCKRIVGYKQRKKIDLVVLIGGLRGSHVGVYDSESVTAGGIKAEIRQSRAQEWCRIVRESSCVLTSVQRVSQTDGCR